MRKWRKHGLNFSSFFDWLLSSPKFLVAYRWKRTIKSLVLCIMYQGVASGIPVVHDTLSSFYIYIISVHRHLYEPMLQDSSGNRHYSFKNLLKFFPFSVLSCTLESRLKLHMCLYLDFKC